MFFHQNLNLMILSKKNIFTTFILILSCHSFSQEIETGQNSTIKDSVSVKIYVGFLVTKKGKVKDVKVVKTEGGPCSNEDLDNYKKEAIRVVSKSQDFKKSKEEKRLILPIKFEIEQKTK
jgi:hypothetical protein